MTNFLSASAEGQSQCTPALNLCTCTNVSGGPPGRVCAVDPTTCDGAIGCTFLEKNKNYCEHFPKCPPVTHVLPPEAPNIALFPPEPRYEVVLAHPEKYELRTLDFPNGVAKAETWCADVLITPVDAPITDVFLRVENTAKDTIPELQTCTPGWCAIAKWSSARRFEEGSQDYGRRMSFRFKNEHTKFGRQVHLVFAVDKEGTPKLKTLQFERTWQCFE
ncbi:hypothetical protein SAMN05192544_1025100 [Paraburkholderia hospita]|nr:hypothetical protein SAMN05192544_1025100 [Paraburkholderia hospita]